MDVALAVAVQEGQDRRQGSVCPSDTRSNQAWNERGKQHMNREGDMMDRQPARLKNKTGDNKLQWEKYMRCHMKKKVADKTRRYSHKSSWDP